MIVEAWDSGFIRTTRRAVHPVLRDIAGYARWWPLMRSAERPDGTFDLRLRARPIGPSHRVVARVTKDRPDLGLRLTYTGDIDGDAEWYYLDEVDGVVVHYLLRGEVRERGGRRLLATHRGSVRHALNVLKDRFEIGRLPGDEPDPALLARQRTAIAEFRAGVEAHARAQQQRSGGGGA